MTTREQAMQFWNSLGDSFFEKIQLKQELTDKYFPKRNFGTLTGSEIEEIWQKEVKTEAIMYTEEDLRKAFRAGFNRANAIEGYPIEDSLTEDEYIDSLKERVVKEDKISFTYSFLRRKMDWEKFCELTGTNEWAKKEGAEFKDNDIYYITESKARLFNLI